MLESTSLTKRHVFGLTLLLFVFIALARLIPLQYFAYDIPYWDQWDGEARVLLSPFQTGELDWKTLLLLPHNEHRVFLTRLTTLTLFLANNRQWDNLVSTCFNALFYAAVFALFLRRLVLELSWRRYLPLFGLIALIACLPFCSENLLTGFQSQFYYMIVLTITGIWFASAGRLTYGRIAVLTMISFGCIFSMASGAFGPLAFLLAATLRWWRERNERGRLILLGAILMPVSLAAIACIPKIPAHQPLHSQNASEFIYATAVALVWPFPGNWWWMILLWMPFAWACLQILRRRLADPIGIAAFTLGAWVILQAAAMSYARGHEASEVSVRYTDILVFGLLVNSYFAIRYYWETPKRSRLVVLGISSLLAVYTAAVFNRTKESLDFMAVHATLSRIQIDNVRHFLKTGDVAELRRQPLFHIPYPDPNVLAMMLENPAIRDALPPSVRTPIPLQGNSAFVANGYFPTTPAGTGPLVLGSYTPTDGDHNIGQLRAALKTRFPYLSFDIAGYPNQPGMKLSLISTDPQHEEPILPPRDPGESWSRVTVPAPAVEFVLEAEDSNPKSWFAFGAPVEVGRLSQWVPRLLSHLLLIAVAYAFVVALLALYFWFSFWSGQDPQGEDSTEAAVSKYSAQPIPNTDIAESGRVLRRRHSSSPQI